MKKIYAILLICVLFFSLTQKKALIEWFNAFYYRSVCDTPIHYRIGSLDSRFGVSQERITSDIEQAAQLWGDVMNKNLFLSDPSNTSLAISFVFDSRQALNNKIGQLETTLETKRSQIDPQVLQYKNNVAHFNLQKSDLNQEIIMWNKKGGAPSEIYNRIIKDQKALVDEAVRLNAQATKLNQSTDLFNSNVQQLNQTVDELNQVFENKPEEGLYDGNTNQIYIYLISDHNELAHTLAHEMGHALSLEHGLNPNSIMYPFVSKTVQLSEEDVQSVQKLCEKQSLIEIGIQKIPVIQQNLQFLFLRLKNL